jgi:two-component system, NtrC family, sensor kinase
MRIVTKINTALAGLIGLSILLNWAALEFTVKPSFADLEERTARDNHGRVLEAISRLEERVRGSARDYAVWDDTYAFVNGELADYLDTNITAESLRALNANFFVIVDNSGNLVVNEGYDFSGEEPAEAHLIALEQATVDSSLLRAISGSEPAAGLIATQYGPAAVGFARIFKSDGSGTSPGTLLIGSVIDIDSLKNTTKVDFELAPVSANESAAMLVGTTDSIEISGALPGLDNVPVGTLRSITPRSISKLGQRTIWSALALIVVAGVAILGALAMLLRRIAIARIERMRSHLTQVGATGSLGKMPDDGLDDELSDMTRSFNSMAAQLGELREQVRQQDYKEGAADHAAGILHNIRNSISPIGTIAWDLANAENATWKDQVRRALSEMQEATIDPDRIRKLQTFVSLSAEKFLAESDHRKRELESMRAMIRHLDEVLAEEDSVSQIERVREAVELAPAIRLAAGLIESRSSARIEVSCPKHIPDVLGSNVNLKQILGNVFINAAEAIEATGRSKGHINIEIAETTHAGSPALDIAISDDGEGIDPAVLTHIFEKGFSTRQKTARGLGLHWCANTINRMGGRIYAESNGVGKGATMHLVLPRAAPAIAAAA